MAVNIHRWARPGRVTSVPSVSTASVRARSAADAAIAIALFAYAILSSLPFPPPPPYGWRGFVAVLVVAVLPLAVRRSRPVVTHTIVCVGLLAAVIARLPGAGGNSALIALLISTYSFSAYARTSRPWLAWPAAAAPLAVLMATRGGTTALVAPILMAEMGVAWFFGSVQRQRTGLAAALDHRALELEATPDETERLAISRERGRIARDLQTLVSAAIDAMVAGARGARASLRHDTADAMQVTGEVAETGRAALQEVRRLLAVLRGRDDQVDRPPMLDQLPALVDHAITTGVRVELSVAGDPSAAAVPSQRAAYRLVEEAIAMVGDRGGDVPLAVVVERDAADLRVTAWFAGDGSSQPAPVAPFDPRVAALHERVALLGGELRTELADGGAFRLEARLPSRSRPGDVLVRPAPRPVDVDTAPDAGGIRRRAGAFVDAARRRPWALDLGAALVLGAVSIGEVLWYPEPFYDAERSWRTVVAVFLIAATLVLRRRAPVAALLTAGVLEFVHHLMSLRWTNVMLLIFAIHIFTVASRRGRATAFAAVAVAGASHAIFFARIVTGAFRTGGLGIPVTAAITIILIVGLRIFGMWIFAAFAGRTLAACEELNDRLADRVRRLMEHRDMQARLAVADERRRIARELHDVVGHGLSVMVLQAGAVGALVQRDLDRAEATLRLIEEMGATAKQELDDLVELLGPDVAPAAPARGIDELIADARRAGLDVSLVIEGGDARGGHLALHAYRIVQEALTNAGKHAAGSRVEVRLRFSSGAVEVEVVNDVPPRLPLADAAVPSGGYGLVGMRERVGLFGGEFAAGPLAEGGYAVRARLPEPALA